MSDWKLRALDELEIVSTETGVPLKAVVRSRLAGYLAELEIWGPRLDLVGPAEFERFGARHLGDAWAALPVLERHLAGRIPRLLDVGSGAGVPGIPVALGLELAQATLLEPRQKRASFLRAAARGIEGCAFDVLGARSEALVTEGQTFDVVLTRATFSPDKLAAACLPLLRVGGILIAWVSSATAAAGLADRLLGAAEILRPDPTGSTTLAIWRKG